MTEIERYREHRFPCLLRVTLDAPSGRSQAEVINISASGARVVCDAQAEPGDRLRLSLSPGRAPLSVQVRWRRGGMLGLRFDHPLAQGDVSRMRASVSNSRAQDRKQLHLGLREMR